jgi:hypothetical protein
MLKITLHDSAHEFRITLEGRLSGPWVGELDQCWQTASSTTAGRKTILDLGEVDFVCPDAEPLLVRMHAHGVEFIAVTPVIVAVLQDICESPRCATVEKKAGSAP